MDNTTKTKIELIVRNQMIGFASGFSDRHIKDVDNPGGAINLKKQNVFISKLPAELVYYSALVRSFDSSFGNLLQKMALEIAGLRYDVSEEVVGEIDNRQLDHISDMINNYRNHTQTPNSDDYLSYSTKPFSLKPARHVSDYVFFDKASNTYHIVELKAGGDLDIKKAPAEKRALLEQYFILKNTNPSSNILLHFATAYNKFGEGNPWNQSSVETFFSRDELLIGTDFWNFVCDDSDGFDVVINSYVDNLNIIVDSLESIKEAYGI
jgi:hypothetical protein